MRPHFLGALASPSYPFALPSRTIGVEMKSLCLSQDVYVVVFPLHSNSTPEFLSKVWQGKPWQFPRSVGRSVGRWAAWVDQSVGQPPPEVRAIRVARTCHRSHRCNQQNACEPCPALPCLALPCPALPCLACFRTCGPTLVAEHQGSFN